MSPAAPEEFIQFRLVEQLGDPPEPPELQWRHRLQLPVTCHPGDHLIAPAWGEWQAVPVLDFVQAHEEDAAERGRRSSGFWGA